MKSFLFFLFVIFSLPVSATTYYISATGNDANNGTSETSPWKSLNKLNSYFSSLNPGDMVLLNRGNVFYGTITISRSGAAGLPITIGAYGTGAMPVITGFTTVSSWSDLGSNIWESTNSVSSIASCNVVVISGVNTPMGRYPNNGYLTYDSVTSNISITSSSLTGSPDWTGAEAVIKKEQYIIDRNQITSQSGSTLNYSGGGVTGQAGWGFFIQNDARTLDTQNEWYYNPSTKKIRIYSTSQPTGVLLATLDDLIYAVYKSYIVFDGISFTGANTDAFYLGDLSNSTIQNCSFDFNYNAIKALLQILLLPIAQ